MANSKATELRKLSDEQLSTKRDELRDELYHLRYKMHVEDVENPNLKTQLRREIARINTVLRERALAAASATA